MGKEQRQVADKLTYRLYGEKRGFMYTLVGVDGNAFAIMGYTARALKQTGHGDLVSKMHEEATAGDYNNLICVCMKYVDVANGEE